MPAPPAAPAAPAPAGPVAPVAPGPQAPVENELGPKASGLRIGASVKLFL